MTIFEALELAGLRWPRTGTLECPAHPDTNPSLKLYQDHFYCFSCQRNGDGYGLLALLTNKPVGEVLRQYGQGGNALLRARKEVVAEVGPTALGKRFRRRWTLAHNDVFDHLHEVFGGEDTDVLVEEIERMGEMFSELEAEAEELPIFEAEKRLKEFCDQQHIWLYQQADRLRNNWRPRQSTEEKWHETLISTLRSKQ